MKYIREYQVFEASAAALQELTAVQIDWLDKCAKRKWKLNPQTGFVDVEGSFYCKGQGLTDFKGVKFGKVGGYFFCDSNQLTTLVGAPQSVGGFRCDANRLTTLVGAPQSVGWGFNCSRNYLTSLVGAPQSVNGDFFCHDNQLTTLEGAPRKVGGGFGCENNQLTSLVGAPQSVKGSFNCADNPVSESTLDSIFALMRKGMGYQQALEKCWPRMGDEDKVLMYKQMPSLSPEETRKYNALATYNNIKGYL